MILNPRQRSLPQFRCGLMQGFREFNESYVVTLGKWGVYTDKVNPVARSNVCPEIDPPAEPSFYAFCFTRPSGNRSPSRSLVSR